MRESPKAQRLLRDWGSLARVVALPLSKSPEFREEFRTLAAHPPGGLPGCFQGGPRAAAVPWGKASSSAPFSSYGGPDVAAAEFAYWVLA
ncbi:hypothetical protein ETH_00002400 [Eimeria tenella]|uniref:Uncharacterized protein n=1 Tax=Eimeria tenella TaxID=5802 RepID=U6L2A2_EIMTE|nr:hypothetical protein ETH_00002400 [Eimeria tenella]CDJ42734.1 hypothetical protein ETH_00002400 [Eimeria tenella]|eukprot:XP_013233484.1 hypothetical protein ETH_00002400 [Eimeria tenella]